MSKCPDCGGTHVRCLTCGSTFSTVERTQLVLDILREAHDPIFGTVLAHLSGYTERGMYNALDRLIAQGKVEKVGTGKQRKGYRLVRIIPFPQVVIPEPLELAA